MGYFRLSTGYMAVGGKLVYSSSAPPDSVSSDISYYNFDATGTPTGDLYVTVTSSGTWTASLVDTGDGINWVLDYNQIGGNGDTCTVTLDANSGSQRSCTLRFTVGSATADVTIVQTAT